MLFSLADKITALGGGSLGGFGPLLPPPAATDTSEDDEALYKSFTNPAEEAVGGADGGGGRSRDDFPLVPPAVYTGARMPLLLLLLL